MYFSRLSSFFFECVMLVHTTINENHSHEWSMKEDSFDITPSPPAQIRVPEGTDIGKIKFV